MFPSHSVFEEHMFSEEFVLGSFLEISCEPVKAEIESRNFSVQCVYKLVYHGWSMSDDNETGILVPKFWPTCRETLQIWLMGRPTT